MTEEIIFKQSLSYAEMAVVTGGKSQSSSSQKPPPYGDDDPPILDGDPDDPD